MYEFPILRKAFSQIPKERFLFGSHYPDKLTVCSVHTFDLLKLTEGVHVLQERRAFAFLFFEGRRRHG